MNEIKAESGIYGIICLENDKIYIEGNRGKSRTPEEKLQNSLAHRGKIHSPETRAKMSLAQRRRYQSQGEEV
jgi:hypothetical protein